MNVERIRQSLAIAAGESERREPDQCCVDQNLIEAITGLLNEVEALEKTTIGNLAARVSELEERVKFLEDEREALLVKLRDYIPRI